MPAASLNFADLRAVRCRVFGRVQGLGVRPSVARLAARCGVAGEVANTADGLTIDIEGVTGAVGKFLAEFDDSLPPGADIERMEVEPITIVGRQDFQIAPRSDVGTGAAAVPPDRGVCPACLAEVRADRGRRRDYGFTSCTACGPRYSVIQAMPYDRPATAMRRFAPCPACEREYRSPDDRRFHAQTNACPECGPQVRLVDESGRTIGPDEALPTAARALRAGRIVALKGLGGYQLLVDAGSPDAVRRLRLRKRRPTKPLAVLVRAIDEAERIAWLDESERRLLLDPAGPIVVVRRRSDAPLAAEVASGFQTVGLMLPTTPLHALLCDGAGRPLVCTSGNLDGEALAYDEREAEEQLRGIADLWLHHDRPIVRPIDDSVVRVIAGKPCFLRLARGYAPLVLSTQPDFFTGPMVALGGDQKGAIALGNGSQAVLGPHVGDLSGAAACERWVEQLESFAELYGVSPGAAEFVHDRHPDYFTTGWARQFRRRQAVGHHHAHVAAVLLEHDMFDREVIGLAWDGTGYGDDGSAWGGEFLRATTHDYRRVARLRPFSLVGGDQAIREPWRVAVELVREALGPAEATSWKWDDVPTDQTRACLEIAERPGLSHSTSSMGRLFDGVAALVLGLSTAGDEGRPAMLLEDACDRDVQCGYSFAATSPNGDMDWRPVVRAIVADVGRGEAPGTVAMRFHRAVADLAAGIAAAHVDLPLVTAGGVFQNRVLGDLLAERVSGRDSGWLRPVAVPIGDGGLAAGQLAVAAARSSSSRKD
jgi:hydrogenase maturation protein HypF